MAEKMIERNKAIILLRSGGRRFLALLAVPLLLIALVLPVSVGAEAYDYNDLPHTVTVDGANDIVTISVDPSNGIWQIYRPVSKTGYGAIITVPESLADVHMYYQLFKWGSGLDPRDIPSGTVISCTISCTWDEQLPHESDNPHYSLYLQSRNASYDLIDQNYGDIIIDQAGHDIVKTTCTYAPFVGAEYLVPIVNVYEFTTDRAMTVEVVSCKMTMSISSLYRQQQLTGKTNQLLGEVEKQLKANGQKLDDVLAQQQANGEKLDGVNDKLEQNGEKLDEIAKHPEQEKQEANGSGNDAVDSIMSGVPDHGKEFQTAIKQFAASASYNGTEAKLHTPAVKMPEIPGLVPGVTIMEPQEVDFGEYIKIIPAPLLTLVQSLLTAALIIYCFKELYDTIQYVLTLKGGGGQ